ncbi:uncharacterized protein LOC125630934 isoform X2 [Caretta caretta]|uniref:uncharacterized protein LOC125630934 isoform X2 n=1 Tax=Caretta caretta TaxID=8467 RepID=UPI003F4C62D3
MGEKGYTRDTQQCRVKINELQHVYQKTREANRHSGSAPQTCCFYEQLHAILGGDPTTTPKLSGDTSQEPQATLSNNEEEDIGEEEENVRQASGGSILPDSQELFLTLEPTPSQDQLEAERDAGEGTSGFWEGLPYSIHHGRTLSRATPVLTLLASLQHTALQHKDQLKPCPSAHSQHRDRLEGGKRRLWRTCSMS